MVPFWTVVYGTVVYGTVVYGTVVYGTVFHYLTIILGMTKEVENLIKENQELIQTK